MYQLQGRVVAEDAVIGGLLQQSPEFRAFYVAERSKISPPVTWLWDQTLPPTVKAHATAGENGTASISVRTVPAAVEDAQTVAEELGHLIILEQGFPYLVAPADQLGLLNIAATINSMLHDLLVGPLLQSYGFDLWAEFEEVQQNTLRILEVDATDPLLGTNYAFLYATNVLDYRAATQGRQDASENLLQAHLDAHYPVITEAGEQLLQLVDGTGFDTPAKMDQLLRLILRRYQWEHVLAVTRLPPYNP